MAVIELLGPNDSEKLEFIIQNLAETDGDTPSGQHKINLLKDDRSFVFCVSEEDNIIGFALVYKFPSLYSSHFMAYLYDIEIIEAHRKKGLGSQLMATVKQTMEAEDVDELWLGTGTDNTPAQALFSKSGGIKSDETFHDYTFEL